MMKRLIPCLLMYSVIFCPCFAGLSDSDAASDGFLDEGEWDGGIVRLEGQETLLVRGGGASWIEAKEYGYIEVQYTSIPLGYQTGIYDIVLYDNSELLYLGGVTEELTIRDDSTAELKGGWIDGITVLSFPGDTGGVTIFCQEDYQWKYVSGQKKGITGLWADGSAFNINFVNVGGPFPPTANFVSVEVIPEPTTMLLFCIGSLLIHRRK